MIVIGRFEMNISNLIGPRYGARINTSSTLKIQLNFHFTNKWPLNLLFLYKKEMDLRLSLPMIVIGRFEMNR